MSCPKIGLTLAAPCPLVVEPTPPTTRVMAHAAAAAAAATGTHSQAPGPDVKLSYISMAINGVTIVLPNVHKLSMHVR